MYETLQSMITGKKFTKRAFCSIIVVDIKLEMKGLRMNRRVIKIILGVFPMVLMISGCSAGGEKETEHSKEAFVTENTMGEEMTEEATIEEPTEQQLLEETTTAQQEQEVSFLFAGDICFEEDGYVLDYYDAMGQELKNCMSLYLMERMEKADIFFLNHEYTISNRGSKLDKYYTFRADPSRMEILKEMSVDAVSLANNHIYDYGYDAFEDTLNLLDQAGIRRVGAGRNASEAEEVLYFDVKGIRIGVVAASRAEKYVITPQAKESAPGVFWMYDSTRLNEVVAEANSKCDFLIAYLHWGTEDSPYFQNYQHEIAESLVANGVDAIIGGHPHVVQGMEYIDNVPVLYSLGDFWFNGEDKYSMMVQLNIKKDGTCVVEIIPCRQTNYCITYIEEQEDKNKFFQYLDELSPGVHFG